MEKPERDLELTCVDCEKKFTFTLGEQEYFWARKLAQPKRCPKCRAFRKATVAKGVEQ